MTSQAGEIQKLCKWVAVLIAGTAKIVAVIALLITALATVVTAPEMAIGIVTVVMIVVEIVKVIVAVETVEGSSCAVCGFYCFQIHTYSKCINELDPVALLLMVDKVSKTVTTLGETRPEIGHKEDS